MNKKFYKVLSFLVAIFLICCQVAASAALAEYKNTPVYRYQRYQAPDGGENPDDDDSDSGIEMGSDVDGSSPDGSEHMTDDEEPENSLYVPFAASAPATEPVSSSSSSSSSSAAASVDAGEGLRSMTIEQWGNASMNDVLADMGVFTKEELKDIYALYFSFILRELNEKFGTNPDGQKYPHIAVARILYKTREDDQYFRSYNIRKIFISSIKHNTGRLDQYPPLKSIALGIAPYQGNGLFFAHSERAVGVCLLQNDTECLNKILERVHADKNGPVIIQIKTSTTPCANCLKFWGGSVPLNKLTFELDSANGENHFDCLAKLKQGCRLNGGMGVTLNCSITVNGVDCNSKPVERLID